MARGERSMKINENIRTNIFIGILFSTWIGFIFIDRQIAMFVLLNLIGWAVLEQTAIIVKAIRDLIQIIKDKKL